MQTLFLLVAKSSSASAAAAFYDTSVTIVFSATFAYHHNHLCSCLVHGAWCMVPGAWCVVLSAQHGGWSKERTLSITGPPLTLVSASVRAMAVAVVAPPASAVDLPRGNCALANTLRSAW
jgi:hypothetical protein